MEMKQKGEKKKKTNPEWHPWTSRLNCLKFTALLDIFIYKAYKFPLLFTLFIILLFATETITAIHNLTQDAAQSLVTTAISHWALVSTPSVAPVCSTSHWPLPPSPQDAKPSEHPRQSMLEYLSPFHVTLGEKISKVIALATISFRALVKWIFWFYRHCSSLSFPRTRYEFTRHGQGRI